MILKEATAKGKGWVVQQLLNVGLIYYSVATSQRMCGSRYSLTLLFNLLHHHFSTATTDSFLSGWFKYFQYWAIVFWVWFFNHHKAFRFSWVLSQSISRCYSQIVWLHTYDSFFSELFFCQFFCTVLQMFLFWKWKKKCIKWMLK